MTTPENTAEKLGFKAGQVVYELGWDNDAHDDLRDGIRRVTGREVLDEDAGEIADMVVLWWREGDGDLPDVLAEAIAPTTDDGVLWILTPMTGKPGHVEADEIGEAVGTAGLALTSSSDAVDCWSGYRLTRPRTAPAEPVGGQHPVP
ncbi:DUF3052 domain-containing protein [Streptomyces sp. NPDC002773]|uniref:DUF3052 domain-containing protein n=1 Tax=Streptomyces sp. NPDC002773 TaxID=3154430 RepID=UPI0033224F7A